MTASPEVTPTNPPAQAPNLAATSHGGVSAAKEAAKESDDRTYVVLRKQVPVSPPESPGAAIAAAPVFEFVANIEATSAQQAVRKAAETPGTSFLDPEGSVTLVAIPSRSFSPITVTVKTTTTVVLS